MREALALVHSAADEFAAEVARLTQATDRTAPGRREEP